MARYENETFENQTVALDGNDYVGCNFVNCTLTYGGQGGARFDNCRMEKYQFQFVGAAAKTLALLKALRTDPAFGPMVEDVIKGLNGRGHLVFQ